MLSPACIDGRSLMTKEAFAPSPAAKVRHRRPFRCTDPDHP
jgi:hypothetical protein